MPDLPNVKEQQRPHRQLEELTGRRLCESPEVLAKFPHFSSLIYVWFLDTQKRLLFPVSDLPGPTLPSCSTGDFGNITHPIEQLPFSV